MVDDPDSIIRKRRKSRKARETSPVQDRPQPEYIAESIEAAFNFAEEYRASTDSPLYECTDEAPSLLRLITDPDQKFCYRWGYLPPLDEEATAIMDAVIADPSMIKDLTRTGPRHPDFPKGLRYRNVFLAESMTPDPWADHIRLLSLQDSLSETAAENESYGQLWIMDQQNCDKGSNEALFQRTVMMSLIARHLLVYDRDIKQSFLAFSVEEIWSCPPMPTRAYHKLEKFLTQPKPDLAVCFRREALISESLWLRLPTATTRLACYETSGETSGKVFHFLTIEAKKATTSTGNTEGMRQSLNNASQALHNMFEFFRDAGSDHQDIFFEQVRFFSVVASSEGLSIHIHRATQKAADETDPGLIIEDRPDYPLRFEHRQFCKILKSEFDRKPVLEMFKKILLGYGGELCLLLKKAAEALDKKLSKDSEAMRKRLDLHFYRYGQTAQPVKSRTQTPAASRSQSMQSNVPQRRGTMGPPSRAPSVNKLHIGSTTPPQTQPTQSASGKTKRGRGTSEDIAPERNTRRRK